MKATTTGIAEAWRQQTNIAAWDCVIYGTKPCKCGAPVPRNYKKCVICSEPQELDEDTKRYMKLYDELRDKKIDN